MKGKWLIAVWISVIVIIQIIGNCLLKNGIVIPTIVDCVCTLVQVLPLNILLFLVMRNKRMRILYRSLAGIFFLISCVALITTIYMMFV